jgi:hypothetical protein
MSNMTTFCCGHVGAAIDLDMKSKFRRYVKRGVFRNLL